jgi:hypothetical protein
MSMTGKSSRQTCKHFLDYAAQAFYMGVVKYTHYAGFVCDCLQGWEYHGACAHTTVRWSGCICIFCAGRCMEFQENWSQCICSCTTHNIGLSGRGRTHPHKRVHHDHASICGICRVLDSSAGIGHFLRVKVFSSLGPCRFSRLHVFNHLPDTIFMRRTQRPVVFFFFFLPIRELKIGLSKVGHLCDALIADVWGIT